MTNQQPGPDEIRQVLVPASVWPRLELFLAMYCGAELHLVGQIGDDDLPTWAITPMLSRLEQAKAEEAGQ
jgi:hypothetical protein